MASLPYPRSPLNYLSTEVSGREEPPTEFTEFTEFSGARYSPTDFTDVHRLGGYGIPAIPTQPTKLSSHRSFWWRSASHRIHRIHRIFWHKIFSHGFHGCAQIRRVWHPCHTHAATKLSFHRSFWRRRASHGIHRIHRIFWRKIFSHGFHGCTQIRRVWHPCHTHAAHQTIFPQKPQNLTQPNHLWASVKSGGGSSTPFVSVKSVNSVGEPYAA